MGGAKTPRLSLLKISPPEGPRRAAGGIGAEGAVSVLQHAGIGAQRPLAGTASLSSSLPSLPRYGAGGPYKRKKGNIFFIIFSVCYERKSRGVFIRSLSCVYFFLIFGVYFETSIIF